MQRHQLRQIILIGSVVWMLILIVGITQTHQGENNNDFSFANPLMAETGIPTYQIASTYTTCDTSIDSTVNGSAKSNQSKVFFHDGHWYMVAKKSANGFWHLWRHDSSRVWTSLIVNQSALDKDQPDVYLDAENNKLYWFFSAQYNSNSNCQLNVLNYTPGTKSWSVVKSSVIVPLIRGGSDTPVSFMKAKSGELWAFSAINSQVIGVISKDDGTTWSDTIVIKSEMQTAFGITDAVPFTGSNGKDYIALGVGENTTNLGPSDLTRFYFFIHEDGADSAVWTDESSNVGPFNQEASDDHLSMNVDMYNSVYMFAKTGGGGSSNPENVLYKRFNDGTWEQHIVIESSSDGGAQYTRPAIVIDETNEALYFLGTWGTTVGGFGKLMGYKKCAIGQESSLEFGARTIVMEDGLAEFWNLSAPFHYVNDATDLFVIADNVGDENIWFTQIGIGPTFPECPAYTDTTVTELSISKNNSDIILEWMEDTIIDSFVIYRGNSAFFEANSITKRAAATSASYTDTAILGDASTHHFYKVQAFKGGVGGPVSETFGEFEIDLIAPEGLTRLNFIANPLIDNSINMASDLVGRVDGGAEVVYKWDASVQGWIAYLPVLPPTNYAVSPNAPYLISVYTPGIICFVGKVPENASFNLLTTSGTNLNTISIPLEQQESTSLASELADQIGAVEVVYKWDATKQGWIAFLPAIPPTDYSIKPGMGLLLNVTAETTWP